MFRFELNDIDWTIKLVHTNTIVDRYNKENEEKSSFVFGLTIYPDNEIWINESLFDDEKLRTLIHELTHCYLWSYGFNNVSEYTEEMVCDIMASAYKFINKTILLYFYNKNNTDNG